LFTHYIEIQGNVDTKENIVISPEYSGILTQLYVKAGQKVSKGQVLARIDDGGLSSSLAQAETQLALAKTTFERQKNLWDQKIGSEIQFLQAKTSLESQQKVVAQIKSQLNKTNVVAPFSGTIDEVMTERGKVVAPGMNLFRIVNLSNMYVTANVPENYIPQLKLGAM
jgi:membrane fusion protein, multidrug efflux system